MERVVKYGVVGWINTGPWEAKAVGATIISVNIPDVGVVTFPRGSLTEMYEWTEPPAGSVVRVTFSEDNVVVAQRDQTDAGRRWHTALDSNKWSWQELTDGAADVQLLVSESEYVTEVVAHQSEWQKAKEAVAKAMAMLDRHQDDVVEAWNILEQARDILSRRGTS